MLKISFFSLFSAFVITSLQAEVILDGSLGPKVALPGPHYQIGAALGQQRGNNLFHSFLDFTLNHQQSATFSGPPTIKTVIGRVTGGQVSHLTSSTRRR
ncbi:MAG: hypothetical protein SVR94_14885 [Pseudomonadota bacterium]|nr:hypothetical protein [Pseudomonadota bacterium]